SDVGSSRVRSSVHHGSGSVRSGGSGGVSSSFVLLAASGQSHSGDQRSQQECLFHACVLKRRVSINQEAMELCAFYPQPQTYETWVIWMRRIFGIRRIQTAIICWLGQFPISPRW